jgi:hypothetical protein
MTTTRDLQRGDRVQTWYDNGADRPRYVHEYTVEKVGPKTVTLREDDGRSAYLWHDNHMTRNLSIRILAREATR